MIFSKLKAGLSKTASKITQGITDIFTKAKLDQETLLQLEELLISADLGIHMAQELVQIFAKTRFDKNIDEEAIKVHFAQAIEKKLALRQYHIDAPHKPEVILICGVNGNGKTTTIGKLSYLYKQEGKRVLLAAADTFRAAASEQLSLWATRVGVDLVQGATGADPASVAYQAVEKAKNEGYDVVLIDTAGRLHTQANLLAELEKINRVVGKLIEKAPHQNILILDGTTGQNAINQLEGFSKLFKITGLIVTKLDGTAKAGILVKLSEMTEAHILAIGVGEGVEDLRHFNATEFSKNLFGVA